MRSDESRTDLGTIKIHKNVIASIASLAACEIEGVRRISGGFGSWMLRSLGNKSLSSITVEIDKNDEVRVAIPLVIKFGYNIPEVAAKVQENVRSALERMTTVSVKDININVQEIEKG
ncbi:MAG: Asp23/Gls24 family envelope stress response protein [Candidatus Omnitrophica bacterium]|nr:Asp23/Gls24 family envelope stress response protein [Candidatus Omnitrophota bacterium]